MAAKHTTVFFLFNIWKRFDKLDVLLISGLRSVCHGLRFHDSGQRFLSSQTRYQNLQKGPQTSHVGRENPSTDQQNYLSRT